MAPPLSKSMLGRASKELLNSEEYADMEFEVRSAGIDVPNGQTQEVKIIAAHRVIVASRCDWFKKALTSGMRESIEK